MKDNEKELDELVQMIDELMAQGGGRVIVKADENAQGIKVDTFVSTDCAGGEKGACCQPNEIDEEYDDRQKG
ncbi:MAG: hypothetical protein IKH90_11635 [Ruminococcus sp.]|nr:hypothetical protein [Ruminococcus sp.]MBR7009263.1 hypothetical protein [Ruminococcus sp.]